MKKFISSSTEIVKISFIYLILYIFISGYASAASFMPVVTNYQARDYHAQLQNWDAAQTERGNLCFANNSGILTYDGYTWGLLPLPGHYIVRSLLADTGRLYVGTFEEFGYYFKDTDGARRYVSLCKGIDKNSIRDDEFWSIIKIGDHIYFQSFVNVFRYSPKTGKIQLLPKISDEADGHKNIRPLKIFSYKGQLMLQNINGGVYTLNNNNWHKIFDTDGGGGKIVGIANGIMATENMGFYRLDSDMKPVPYPTDIDNEIANYHVNNITGTPDGNIVVGTIGNGVYFLTPKGRVIWHISREEGGLCNNSVLGLYVDSFGNVWAMLDDGISLIHTGAPYTMMRPDTNSPDIGMVYDIAGTSDGRLVVAANQGAYFVDGGTTKGEFRYISGTKGQNWCVRTFGDQSFIGGNDQIMEVGAGNSITRIQGACTDIKRGTINGKDVLVQSSYYDVNIFQLENGKWKKANTLAGFGAPLLQLEIDNNGTVWASHLTRGVVSLKLSSDLTKVVESKLYASLDNGDTPQKCYVMKIRGAVVFANDNRMYTYNEHTDKFEPYTAINSQLPWINNVRSSTPVDDRNFWISTAGAYHLIHFEDGKYTDRLTIPLDNFARKVNGVNNRVYCGSNGRAYFNLNGGIGMVDMNNLSVQSKFKPQLSLSSVGYMNSLNEFIALPPQQFDDVAEIEEGNMHLVFSYPDFDHGFHRFRFILKGNGEEVVRIQDVPEINYPHVSPGSYTVKCQVLDNNDNILGELDYRFSVPKPWPLRWWAICLYFIILISVGMVASRLYMRKQLERERQMQADARAEKDREIHRQQLVIAEQQKQLLEKELTEKGKELASMALDAYSRQQVMSQLKASLSDARSKSSASTFRLLSTHLQKLNAAEGDANEFWSVFEKNFDLIHEHFFRNLRQAYPQLTAADLRVCALMRLNLSTKDMARLQGLSVRGIETARYRLRKKLNLPSDVSLNEFMIDFSADKTDYSTTQQPYTAVNRPADQARETTDSTNGSADTALA